MPLTGIERMRRFLKRQPMDRIPVYEHFWDDTWKAWATKSHTVCADFDMAQGGWYNIKADVNFQPEVVEETEDTVTWRDGNGAVLKRHKKHDTTPDHIDFACKTPDDWYGKYKPLVEDIRGRFSVEPYAAGKKAAAEAGKFFALSSHCIFAIMKDILGHEGMLTAMALEPEWMQDMALTYANMHLAVQEEIIAQTGKPDGVWFYEDLGFKEKPFISPAMYDAILKPAHKLLFDSAKSRGLPIIMHSCGFVEPLIGGFVDAGIDCLQVLEVKAGMDPLRIHRNFGDRLSLMGGLDIRTLLSNDQSVIDKELEAKVPMLKQNYGFCLHSDHSIPPDVEYETYRYFVEKGLALGRY